MKTDLYTKAVLTVIASALAIIAFQNAEIFPKANASKVAAFAAVPVNPDGSINVKMTTDNMKVDISAIGGNSIYGSLPINLKEINGSSINTSYGIPVNIEAVDGTSIFETVPVKMKN
jgi:hypothetical protein